MWWSDDRAAWTSSLAGSEGSFQWCGTWKRPQDCLDVHVYPPPHPPPCYHHDWVIEVLGREVGIREGSTSTWGPRMENTHPLLRPLASSSSSSLALARAWNTLTTCRSNNGRLCFLKSASHSLWYSLLQAPQAPLICRVKGRIFLWSVPCLFLENQYM